MIKDKKNGYPKWMINDKKKKQYNRPPEFRSKVVLPYSADLGETLKRILERHRIRTIFKPIIKLSTFLASGKDAVPASKCRGVVYAARPFVLYFIPYLHAI